MGKQTILGGTIEVQLDGENAPIILGTTDGDITLEMEKDEKLIYTRMSGSKTPLDKKSEISKISIKGTIADIDANVYEMVFGGKLEEKTYKKDDIYLDGSKLVKEKKDKKTCHWI